MDIEQLIVSMHSDLASKVDAGFKDVASKFAAHELSDEHRFGEVATELNELQNTRTTIRWFIGVVVVALLAAAAEHVINHRTPDILPAVSASQR